jgi:ADP-ribosylglycohydrolase
MDLALSLENRLKGAIFGSVIGNVMGSPVETWDWKKIQKVYGEIQEPLNMSRLETEDDFRIALLYYEGYLTYGRAIGPEELAEIWLQKFTNADKFFWCMRNSLELLRRGVSPRQTGMYNINTGSAIMAIAPVGIYNMGNPDRAYQDALSLAYMYQPEPDALAAAALAAGVSVSFSSENPVSMICDTILKFSSKKKLVQWDDRKLDSVYESVKLGLEIAEKYNNWRDAREELYREVLQWHSIDPIEVLTLSTALLKITNGDFMEGLKAGTNIGRDSDTISNILGTLSGLIHGYEVIPKEWLEEIESSNRPLFDKLHSVADQMVKLLRNKWNREINILNQLVQL